MHGRFVAGTRAYGHGPGVCGCCHRLRTNHAQTCIAARAIREYGALMRARACEPREGDETETVKFQDRAIGVPLLDQRHRADERVFGGV